MTMRIHQINCAYSSEEDRMLLRISTLENEEHQFLVTRRYLKLLLAVFTDYFRNHEPVLADTESPIAKKSISEFQHQQALEKVDLSKPYQDVSKTSDAKLLYKLSSRIETNTQLLLGLYAKDNKGIEIVLSNDMVHSFYYLIEKTLTTAEWDLNLYLRSDESGFQQGKPTIH